MINFNDLDFTNKTILEVGTGRGGTTLKLAKVLKNFRGAKLITTDVYDGNFEKVKKDLEEYNIDISFIKTDGCELQGIDKNSIDFIVCNYTLCAINSKSGSETLALNKFKEVLKLGGMLYIEEEYPLNIVDNPMQQVWSRKWQLLRAANMLLGELSFNEIKPEILEKLLYVLGFNNIQCENETYQILGEDCLEFFNYRFSKVLDRLNNSQLVQGLTKEVKVLENDVKEIGGMEIPTYKIIAVKGK
ncbi:tRNA (cmo5U34)-methyltransferase [Clostridium tepidiprofundi DSM 19306]|uniref:tRNA (Cmo5U34)-methyltransferase n=1 Tax=Clostridium tepidiprofundi DSM 19306 TaxID=1121338 RepID=A0A151AZ09_9CLOT|nr:class I SAM-dependent methyltransferase [Clostridium tepidiprofundi]KYH32871.1 tRNA (cmo5U34)-methyltransferase [Clostridium tepidiprofundi DSM 19306]